YRVGSAFLVRRDCLFQAVASLRASASPVSAHFTGWLAAAAFGGHRGWRVPGVFVRVRFLAFVAGARLSHPFRLGCRFHSLQLASLALFPHACSHSYLRQSYRRCSIWLVLRVCRGTFPCTY